GSTARTHSGCAKQLVEGGVHDIQPRRNAAAGNVLRDKGAKLYAAGTGGAGRGGSPASREENACHHRQHTGEKGPFQPRTPKLMCDRDLDAKLWIITKR